jgi:2-polyprenyl-3-methyl-5-hydroxy-6-metoxy-1,4-benzoquinol methylase
MLLRIPASLLELYRPLSPWESFYLRTRWRLCPFELLESLLPRKGRILDFGCGYGLLSNLLALRGPDRFLTGIDLNEKRIAVARRSAGDRTNVTFLLGNVESLNPEPFDAAVMTDVLHHIRDDRLEMLLRKIHACLGRDGILAVLDVARAPLWKFCVTYSIDRMLNLMDRLWYRPMPSMLALLKRSGFQVEEVIRADRDLPLSDVLVLCRRSMP